MKKTFIIFFILITSICNSQTYTGKVIGIKDGDTVVVLDSLNYQTTLRLAEVDCPEKSQPFGTKAKQFTSDQIYRKEIKYVVTDIDRYGRSIAMIYYDDNKYLSAELIKIGLAWHYKRYSISEELANFENSARTQSASPGPRVSQSSAAGTPMQPPSLSSGGTRIYLATPRLRGLLALNLAIASGSAMVIVNTVVLVQAGLGLTQTATAMALAAF